jgi:HAD superfamily hydrolase (TIGR01509 family)
VVRAVVFDFDGVIANSEPLHFRAFRDVLAARGIALTERDYYERYLGFDDVGAIRAAADDYGVGVSEREVADLVATKALRMEELEREGSVLFAGARQAIERIADECPIAIASGAIRAEIVRVLEREQLLRFFPAIVGAEDAPRSKPAPDPYLRAVALLSSYFDGALRAAECVAVEDSHWGLVSARDAGLRTIAVTHTYAASALAIADRVIDRLDQLTWPLLCSFDQR